LAQQADGLALAALVVAAQHQEGGGGRAADAGVAVNDQGAGLPPALCEGEQVLQVCALGRDVARLARADVVHLDLEVTVRDDALRRAGEGVVAQQGDHVGGQQVLRQDRQGREAADVDHVSWSFLGSLFFPGALGGCRPKRATRNNRVIIVEL
jgi:hypothetical protein